MAFFFLIIGRVFAQFTSHTFYNLIIYPKKMLSNLNITKGLIFSQEIMLELND